MDVSPALISSLRAAVAAAPDDVALRLHLAELLLSSGDATGAVAEAGRALHADPTSPQARELMIRAIAAPLPTEGSAEDGPPAASGGPAEHAPAAGPGESASVAPRGDAAPPTGSAVPAPPGQPTPAAGQPIPAAGPGEPTSDAPYDDATQSTPLTPLTVPVPEDAPAPRVESAPSSAPTDAGPQGAPAGGNRPDAESATPTESADVPPPAGNGDEGSAEGADGPGAHDGPDADPTPFPPHSGSTDAAPPADVDAFDWSAAEQEIQGIVGPAYVAADPQGLGHGYPPPPTAPAAPEVTLADVGGMEAVKERLHAAFLAPMRNPELQRLYGKSLRGGLLLYGPPGCGKTFIARALAGELGADFLAVGIADVLDMYLGQSERNIGAVFAQARRRAPCVVFFDEVDAIGRRRDHSGGGGASVVHQLLLELDGVHAADNDGVFVLAATNQPWEVDPALRRPGRFDRTVLVVPPDASARDAILRYHLRDRPIENIEVDTLVAATEGFSGADLAHVCDSAAERALLDSAASGEVRMMRMGDFEAALADIRPSTDTWLETARGVAMFGNQAGAYDELVAYLNGRTAR
ncbi:ATP-binding protein [Nocardiopsis trehalosi]|uniref:ATP-binding protein n=1 Tax=Nocardiopsis trehalosi TaxID=109329 RepID=UPI000835BECA|nr:AAA family ATPase [Nocardiopsis trehalosi]